jgi:hypothetical protein
MAGRGKSARSLALIAECERILEQIQPATVRGVCYKLFTFGHIPKMEKKHTDNVSRLLVWARENDVIPWEWLVDESDVDDRNPTWANPVEYVEAVKRSYRRDRWATQLAPVEVWSEKSTVAGVLRPVTNEYGVRFRRFGGFASRTKLHNASDTSWDHVDEANILAGIGVRPVTVLYVGDYDPSGMHMSQVDIPDHLAQYNANVDIECLAITLDDINQYRLTPHEAASKRKDPRYRWFVQNYGSQCWELDALDPNILRDKVEAAIREHIDWDAWNRCVTAERAECASLQDILGQWQAARSA